MENAPAVKPAEDVFQIMDRLDDELIEAELKNRVVNTWSYSFKGSDGRLQEGLSKVGVDEACVEMSKRGYIIREGQIVMTPDPTNAEYMLFQVPASLIRITGEGKEVLMDVVNGTKRQWIRMKLKDGSTVKDPFWYEKGAMKAARNARSRLIPSETKAIILMLARQKGKQKEITSGTESPLKPPKKSSEKSKKGASVEDQDQKHTSPSLKKTWPSKEAFIADIQSFEEKLGEDVYADFLSKHEINPAELDKLDNKTGPALYDDLEAAYKKVQETEGE